MEACIHACFQRNLTVSSVGSNVLHNIVVTKKYNEITGNITQVTLLANVTRYLSNSIVTVMNLILCNMITTSNEVTNLISNPLSNA